MNSSTNSIKLTQKHRTFPKIMIRSNLTNRNESKLVKANIEGIFRCSEMQQAFYLLNQQSGDDPGVILAQADLVGVLDHQVFVDCWNAEMARHETLRMSVRPKKDQTPMLVVWKELEQEFGFVDADVEGQSENHEVENELKQALKAAIQLEIPPVSKVCLRRLSDNQHRMYWAFHHLFMDGWSTSIILRDVITRYNDRVGGQAVEVPPVKPSYSELFKTTEALDYWAIHEFWSNELKGFQGCTPLVMESAVGGAVETGVSSYEINLSQPVAGQLQDWLRQKGITTSVIATAAWSLMLQRLYGEDDVAFAMTVSGRNLPLDGIENFVGLLSSVVPVRAQLDRSQTIYQWLNSIRDSQFRSRSFEQVPINNLPDLCHVPPGRTLFETLLVVENFELPRNEAESSLSISNFSSGATSSFPITCYVLPGEQWKVRVDVDARMPDAAGLAQKLSENYSQMLGQFLADQDGNVQQLLANTEELSVSVNHELRKSRDSHFTTEYSETEIRLASIWESVLGLIDVLPTDHFFEIGGKSLTAVRICNAIEKEFGLKLAPTILIEYPTLAQLAKRISDGDGGPSELIRFNDTESEDLLICVHAGSGYASYYRHLARHFEDVRVVGVQNNGLTDGKPSATFEELADVLVGKLGDDELANKRIHLLGYCLGAVLMFEMARNLQSRGIRPENLFVIDTGPHWKLSQRKLSEHIEYTGSTIKGLARFVYAESKRWWNRQRELQKYRQAMRDGDVEFLAEYRQELIRQNTFEAYLKHQITPTDVPVSFIRSSDFVSKGEREFHFDWREYSSNFQHTVVEGIHEELMLEPHVANVAIAVRSVMPVDDHSASSTIWRN